MIKRLLHILVVAGALLLIANYVPGIAITSLTTALFVALVWGFVGVTIRPVLSLLTLPINLLTLGLFSLIVNALLFWGVAYAVPGFTVTGFLPALEGSLILMLVQWVASALL